MNAERLLEVYGRISEAPDAIARLRRFVLDLAVRGKLVEQDARDEPALELLKRISTVKVQLEESGRVRRSKEVEAQSREKPFPLPDQWAWTSLQKLARARMGKTILSKELADEGLPVFSAGMENRPWGYVEASDVIFSRGTIVISARGGIGYPKIPDFDEFVSTQTTIACECFNNEVATYTCLVLEVLPDWQGIKSQTAIPMITVKQVHGIPIPLPPLAEQRRIVAKVDELMALCDRLEEARKTREDTRDKLTAAGLLRLTAPDTTPEDFPAHATFALEALPALTTRPDQIKTLRQTILNLAVRGKLVEQDSADEPASTLVQAIASQKYIEIKSAGVSNIPSSDSFEERGFFDIPSSWKWVPAVYPAVGVSDNGKKIKTRDVLPQGEFPVVDQGKIRVRGFCNDPKKVIHVERPLIVFGDHTRETKLIDFDFVVGADGVKILRPVVIDPQFFFLALSWLPLDSRGYGRHFKLLKSSLIPLPPLAEQSRIVAKVDTHMTLCDRLEAALATTDTARTRLLEAVLHEALKLEAQVLEAAE